jgi:NAD(P)-dependent dehydrogenase (short-subunit alcohol dehydrogenase family)
VSEGDLSATGPLAGTVALVVGFANPAGRAIASALAGAGADIAAASATLDGDEIMAAKRAAREAQQLGRRAFSQGWDVTLPTNAQVGLKQLIRELGHPAVLVFNADAELEKPLEKITDTELGRVLQVNLAGAFSASRSFVRELPAGMAGRLIYVTARFGPPSIHLSAYAAAKSGVHGLARALASELEGRDITVNCIDAGLHSQGLTSEGLAGAIAELTLSLATLATPVTGEILDAHANGGS